jgi:hypothetical protein
MQGDKALNYSENEAFPSSIAFAQSFLRNVSGRSMLIITAQIKGLCGV